MAQGEQAAAPTIRTGSIPYRQRDPPTFAGFGSDDVDEWLRTFERVSVHNAWDNTLKLANVVFYLRDTAKVWFDNHEEQIASWDAFKTRLSDVFGCPVSRKENATQRLATRAQSTGESITTYIEDILALCKRVNPTMPEKEKVENIMKGIAEDAFAVLVSRNPTTVAQLQEECQRWEGHRSRRIASPFTISRLQNCVASSGPPLTGDIKNLIRQIIKEELAVLLAPSRRDLQGEPVDLSPEGVRTLIRNELAQSAPSPQETVCAASPAHAYGAPTFFPADYNPRFVQNAERTWSRQFPSPPATRRPTCFYCGIPGHIARFCRRRIADTSRAYDSRAFPQYRDYHPDSYHHDTEEHLLRNPRRSVSPSYRARANRSPSPAGYRRRSPMRVDQTLPKSFHDGEN